MNLCSLWSSLPSLYEWRPAFSSIDKGSAYEIALPGIAGLLLLRELRDLLLAWRDQTTRALDQQGASLSALSHSVDGQEVHMGDVIHRLERMEHNLAKLDKGLYQVLEVVRTKD